MASKKKVKKNILPSLEYAFGGGTSSGGGGGNVMGYAGAATSLMGGIQQMSQTDTSNLTKEQAEQLKQKQMSSSVDNVASSIPVYGQIYGLAKGASDIARSNLGTEVTDPVTGEVTKKFDNDAEKAGDAFLKPQHEYITDAAAKKDWGNAALSIVPGAPQIKSMFAMGGNLGQLTEFNNGGTHEENPNGGIPLGQNASVEEGETKWQDYIFSDRIPTGNKKETFADASKKIQKKYTRENDAPTQKALEREMNTLMGKQEILRTNLGIVNQPQEFANGGDSKSKRSTNLAITAGDTQVRQNDLISRRDQINDPNYAYLKEIEPTYAKSNLHAEGVNPALKDFETEVNKKNEDIMEFRRQLYTKFKDVPLDKSVNVKGVDPVTGERYFSDDAISNYEKNLDWKNEVYRNYYGYTPKDYRGAKEKEAGKANNPNELLYGPRMRTGATDETMKQEGWQDKWIGELKGFVEDQNPEDRKLINSPKLIKAMGGKIEMWDGGLHPDSLNAINQTLNPNLGTTLNPQRLSAQTTNAYTGTVDNNPAKFQSIKDIEAEIAQAKALEAQNNAIAQKSFKQPSTEPTVEATRLTTNPSLNSQSARPGMDKGDYVAMGAQMLPAFYNLGKGLQGSKPIKYGRLNPNLVDYSSSAKVTNDSYDQQGNIINESIRENATSAGQALSNKIAHSNIAAKQKADALSQIGERQMNTNQQIRGTVDQSNLQVSINEEIANAQQDAANQEAVATGLGQLGQAAGTINRDRNSNRIQDDTIRILGDGRQYTYVYNPVTKRQEMKFINA